MAEKQSVWVLTKEVNEYDQFGEYFVTIFAKKPDAHEVVKYLSEAYGTVASLTEAALRLVEKGGGRIGVEHTWFHLRKVIPK